MRLLDVATTNWREWRATSGHHLSGSYTPYTSVFMAGAEWAYNNPELAATEAAKVMASKPASNYNVAEPQKTAETKKAADLLVTGDRHSQPRKVVPSGL